MANKRRTRAEAAAEKAAKAAETTTTSTPTAMHSTGITEAEFEILSLAGCLTITPDLEPGFYKFHFTGLTGVRVKQLYFVKFEGTVAGKPINNFMVLSTYLEERLRDLGKLLGTKTESTPEIIAAAKGKVIDMQVVSNTSESGRTFLNYFFRAQQEKAGE